MKTDQELLDLAEDLAQDIAFTAHREQFRRDGVTPYIDHVILVVSNVRKRGGGNTEKIVAYLHDVVEDNKAYTLEYIRAEFGERVADAVDALTHRKGETYEQSIERAKANPVAHQVKIADNLANLSDNPTDKQIAKYAKSLQFLMQ